MAKAHKENPNIVWACDTEVADIDLSLQGPVGNGRVTCVSIYSQCFDGDFGDGPGCALWIDNLGDADGVLQEFKAWFEDDTVRKVWHNYSFDRHVMGNEGINVMGFHGDTMHMARLWDTARDKISGGGGYKLEALTSELLDDQRFAKVGMKQLFGKGKLRKDGTESKILVLPNIKDLQLDPLVRDKFIKYSVLDAISTCKLYWELERLLNIKDKKMEWVVNNVKLGSLSVFYDRYLKDFGELLTDMERNGILVDGKHLKDAEIRATQERGKMVETFITWALNHCKDAQHINTASTKQMQQFFFGDVKQDGKCENIGEEKIFKIDKDEALILLEQETLMAENPYAKHNAVELKKVLKERGLVTSGKKDELFARLMESVEKDGKNYVPLPVIETSLQKYTKMKVADLKSLLKERGLVIMGKKVDFIARLCEDDNVKNGMINEGESISVKTSSSEQITPIKTVENSIYFDMDIEYLRDTCREKAISDVGERRQLIENLMNLKKADNEKYTDNDTYADEYNKYTFMEEAKEAQTSSLSDSTYTAPTPTIVPKKYREIKIKTLNMVPTDFTPLGTPQVSASVLRKMSGKDPFGEGDNAAYGSAYDFFGGGAEGRAACQAICALANIGQIDATITNFLVPLQFLANKESRRVHCSLNLNTETGRLSSRKPNLQNQPALEKDQYKIRDAFIAGPGNTLIVADYGQLELRLLADITNCQSMLDAFTSGGCFHSRTAVGMYPHVKRAVENGEVLLEWDYSKGQPTVPLVKDTYASERRKAKTLNFSIAYGKTVHGLALDWGISQKEAEDTLGAWYRDRPEVKSWQDDTRKGAKKDGYVRTIMGRYRNLPDAKGRGPGAGHALRAAINTPIQGSAADIVMMAMIKLWKSEVLKNLGWKLLLQIHDEVILEGPKENMDQAMVEVRSCMERPFDDVLQSLKVTLDVDAKSADSWYKAK
mmetsp:Transcript_36196/g.34234  ORF Transcript_36196/g.34234 Transcript_36196/m.34234 type:complete len:946 (-) Transcript_36196:18-2855(-)|eukprot:CAMPEP_0119035476 /NCGR_PEP_ID=MMETSP1177-20130426/2517_1 /TAXON_ID=2985 /ORGANISM="Ochromonas sp, Strain CCMP1899" /LENGTH=945 /DNA_ID=CAMNT_0006993789 /DNA_START=544 /DNA_END=3381 /DNA_ORIENTATION=-